MNLLKIITCLVKNEGFEAEGTKIGADDERMEDLTAGFLSCWNLYELFVLISHNF